MKRSPLKEAPLRVPGGGLLVRMLKEALPGFGWLAISCGIAIFVLGTLLQRIIDIPIWLSLAGMLFSLMALVLGAIRLGAAERKSAHYLQGAMGERAVADRLLDLAVHGYRSFHSLPSRARDGADLDHVVVGPSGIYAIETKTWSVADGEKLSFDGAAIVRTGGGRDVRPVNQVRAVASEIRKELNDQLGIDIEVKSIVVFPGWWVNEAGSKGSPVWVLNDKRLLGWILNAPQEPRLADPQARERVIAFFRAWARGPYNSEEN